MYKSLQHELQGFTFFTNPTSTDYHLINKQEATKVTAHSLITHITPHSLTFPTEGLESHSIVAYNIMINSDQFRIITSVIGYRNNNLGWHKDTRTANLHKVCRHRAYRHHLLKINDHIDTLTAQEPLPALVSIGPATAHAIDQRTIATSSIARVIVRSINISNLFTYTQMTDRTISTTITPMRIGLKMGSLNFFAILTMAGFMYSVLPL